MRSPRERAAITRRRPTTATVLRRWRAMWPSGSALGPLEATEVELVAVLHDVDKLPIDPQPPRLGGPARRDAAGAASADYRRAAALTEIAGLEHLANLVRATHEAWDGTGYPTACAASGSRSRRASSSAADSFDAMTSDRAYRTALPRREACRRLRSGAGQQLDPRVVDALLRVVGCGPLRRSTHSPCARAARGRDHCPPPRRRAARRDDRVRAGAGHQRAEDVRPAAARDRGRDDRGRAPARQAPRRRHRRRPRAARAPHVAPGGCSSSTSAPVAARPHVAPARADRPRRRRASCACASSARAGRVGEGPARRPSSRRTRRSRRSGPRRGPTRRRCASCSPRRARGRCTRVLRDQRVISGIGRSWVDEILWTAHLSPFKRGDDLDDWLLRPARSCSVLSSRAAIVGRSVRDSPAWRRDRPYRDRAARPMLR